MNSVIRYCENCLQGTRFIFVYFWRPCKKQLFFSISISQSLDLFCEKKCLIKGVSDLSSIHGFENCVSFLLALLMIKRSSYPKTVPKFRLCVVFQCLYEAEAWMWISCPKNQGLEDIEIWGVLDSSGDNLRLGDAQTT